MSAVVRFATPSRASGAAPWPAVTSGDDAISRAQDVIDKVAEIGEAAGLSAQAAGNWFDDFVRGKEDVLIDATLRVQEINDQFLRGLLDDDRLRSRMTTLVMRSLYDEYTQPGAAS